MASVPAGATVSVTPLATVADPTMVPEEAAPPSIGVTVARRVAIARCPFNATPDEGTLQLKSFLSGS